jgi:hypothetical protein
MNIVPRIKLIGILLCAASIAGCAVGWTRPNTTESEFYGDRYQCEQDSARMYPVMMTQSSVGTGYQSPSQTNCNSYGNNVSCTTMPGTYVPPTQVVNDANLMNRNSAFSSCLNSKGYTFKMEFKR